MSVCGCLCVNGCRCRNPNPNLLELLKNRQKTFLRWSGFNFRLKKRQSSLFSSRFGRQTEKGKINDVYSQYFPSGKGFVKPRGIKWSIKVVTNSWIWHKQGSFHCLNFILNFPSMCSLKQIWETSNWSPALTPNRLKHNVLSEQVSHTKHFFLGGAEICSP